MCLGAIKIFCDQKLGTSRVEFICNCSFINDFLFVVVVHKTCHDLPNCCQEVLYNRSFLALVQGNVRNIWISSVLEASYALLMILCHNCLSYPYVFPVD